MTNATNRLLAVAAVVGCGVISSVAQVTLPIRIGPGSDYSPQLTGLLQPGDEFGASVADIGDLDGNGLPELVVGAPGPDIRSPGAIYVLFLGASATVDRVVKIDSSNPAFDETIGERDNFGAAIAALGDIDSDGRIEIAVGGPGHDFRRGAVWILSINTDATLFRSRILDAAIEPRLQIPDQFGRSVAHAGDVDGDGHDDLVVGVPGDNKKGGVFAVLNVTGEPKTVWSAPAFEEHPVPTDASFGLSVASGDLDGNGSLELLVGSPFDEFDNERRGSVMVGVFETGGRLSSQRLVREGTQTLGLTGWAVVALDDLDGNGFRDVAVGSPGLRNDRGDAQLLYMGPPGLTTLVGRSIGDVTETLIGREIRREGDEFGGSLANVSDLDGDGRSDLLIGAPGWPNGNKQGSIWIVSSPDAPLPVIESVVASPSVPSSEETIVVSARAHDDQEKVPLALRLHLRQGGDTYFFSVPMTESSHGVFETAIPPGIVSSRGVEYFVEATNPVGFSSRMPATGFVSLPVRVANGVGRTIRHGDASTAYQLISFPLELNNRSARELLEPHLGKYNPKKWRFFQGDGTDRKELSERDVELLQGRAYWLIVKDRDRTIRTGTGISARTDTTFAVPLSLGWNLVGTPFDFAIPLAAIRLASGQSLDVRLYDGDWQVESKSMVPRNGYVVYTAADADTLLIDPVVARAAQVVPLAATDVDRGLRMRISAYKGSSKDTENYALLSETGLHGWDHLDRHEPPRIGDYISLSFERRKSSGQAIYLSTDAQPVSSDRVAWNLLVSAETGGHVELRFEDVDKLSRSRSVWLLDDVADVVHDLIRSPQYGLALGGTSLTRRLKIEIAPSAEVPRSRDGGRVGKAPGTIDVFPNPFRAATTIRYSLVEGGHTVLSVYDLLGRLVRVLLDDNDHPAGAFAAVWDGRSAGGAEVASGLYALQLSVGDRVKTTRMVALVR